MMASAYCKSALLRLGYQGGRTYIDEIDKRVANAVKVRDDCDQDEQALHTCSCSRNLADLSGLDMIL